MDADKFNPPVDQAGNMSSRCESGELEIYSSPKIIIGAI
jgi:hypothetical protein